MPDSGLTDLFFTIDETGNTSDDGIELAEIILAHYHYSCHRGVIFMSSESAVKSKPKIFYMALDYLMGEWDYCFNDQQRGEKE